MSDTLAFHDDEVFVLLDFKGDCLDPASLIPLIPLPPIRPRKKGDPTGPVKNGKAPTAKTGYCGFTTAGRISSQEANDHVRFVLTAIQPNLGEIRSIMSSQSLAWRAVLFEGSSKGQFFADLDPELSLQAAELGLPLLPKEKETMTVKFDARLSG